MPSDIEAGSGIALTENNIRYDFGDGRGFVFAKRHQNGGGLVANTANVDASVYLGSDVVVFGYARIKDQVRITGRARISGKLYPCGMSTLIEDSAQICGNVIIEGCVLIRDFASIRGHVKLSGGVQVMHHAVVAGKADLSGDLLIIDSSYIAGNVKISANDCSIQILNDQSIHGDRHITNQDQLRQCLESDRNRRRVKQKPDFDVRAERCAAA